jgi:hypothetical protein
MTGNTQVTMGRAPNSDKYLIRVAVYSGRTPNVVGSVEIDPGFSNGKEHLIQMSIAAAGASCEYLCEKYGVTLDPDKCARDAIDDFGRECLLMDDLGKGFPEKVKRLLNQPLLPHERQKLDKLQFFISRGADPTSSDDAWVHSLLIKYNRKRGQR